MTIGSLFSGYGGLDRAVEQVTGATTAWHCECEAAPSRILAAHWPGVPNLGDITAVDWPQVESVDIIAGGFPCQDISNAGRRAGIDGARSGLWREYARAISHLRPRLVVVENVSALLGRGLGRVLGDLAALGYDAEWTCLQASDVGAPHRRERLFILAHTDQPGRQGTQPATRHLVPDGGVAADTGGEAGDIRAGLRPDGARGQRRARPDDRAVPAADAARDGRHEGWAEPAGQFRGRDAAERSDVDWGQYARAICRWEHVIGRPAPAPTEPGPKGGRRLSARAVEFMMGVPDGWVTDVAGISRNAQLKMLGNGVVPQQAAEALRRMGIGVERAP